MTSIQPELWVERAGQAVAFYAEAFGARVLHLVGEGDDIVAQLAVGEAAFWVAAAAPGAGRFSPGGRSVRARVGDRQTDRALAACLNPRRVSACSSGRATATGRTPLAAAIEDDLAGRPSATRRLLNG